MKSVEQSPGGGQGKSRVSILIVTAERTHRRIVGGRGRRWKVVPEQGEDEGGRGSLRRLAVSQMCRRSHLRGRRKRAASARVRGIINKIAPSASSMAISISLGLSNPAAFIWDTTFGI